MQPEHPGIGEQAFGKHADALVTVPHETHRHALKFISSVLRSRKGIGVLHGPHASGKSTIARRVKAAALHKAAVALVDGTDLRPRALLTQMLTQFGYDTGLHSINELLKMASVFAMQQARSKQPPILIVDNIEHMYPSAVRALNALAAVRVGNRYAIRMILTGRDGLSTMIASEDMSTIARRQIGIFTLGPLSSRETMQYLHARLTACGVQHPDTLFPIDSCQRVRELSGGWPGLINHYAQEALSPKRPRLIVTRNGETVTCYTPSTKKVLIGRSEFADVVLDDDFVSKMHAVLLLYSNALVLLDLNSANGTTVNSVAVNSTILRGSDIISIGHFRLKVENAPALSADIEARLQSADTVKMRTLPEMRRLQEEQKALEAEKQQQA